MTPKAVAELSKYSSALSGQILNLLERVQDNAENHSCNLSYQTLNTCLQSIRLVMKPTLENLPEQLKQNFVDNGFDCFTNEANRSLFEYHAWTASQSVNIKKPIITAVTQIVSMHLNKHIEPRSTLNFDDGKRVGFAHGYILGYERFCELQSMLYKYIELTTKSAKAPTEGAIRTLAHRSLRFIAHMVESKVFNQSQYKDSDLESLFKDKNFIVSFTKQPTVSMGHASPIYTLLRKLYPTIYMGRDIAKSRQSSAMQRLFRLPRELEPSLNTLVAQLSNMYVRSSDCGDGKIHTLGMTRFQNSARSLLDVIPKTLENMPPNFSRKFITSGFDSLTDETNRALFEYHAWKESLTLVKRPRIKLDEAIANLLSMHRNVLVEPSSHLTISDGKTIDITRAYELGHERFIELLPLLSQLILKQTDTVNRLSEESIRSSVNDTVNAIMRIATSESFKKFEYCDFPITEMLKDRNFVLKAIGQLLSSGQHSFRHFLRVVLPEIYGEARSTNLRRDDLLQGYLQSISPKFATEMNEYLSIRGTSPITKSYCLSFVKFIHKKGEKAELITSLLRDNGIAGLALNSGAGFKRLELLIGNDEARRPLNVALDLFNYLCKQDNPVRLSCFLPHILQFQNPNDGSTSSVNLHFFYTHLPKLFDDINEYHAISKVRTDAEAKQQITTRGIVYSFSLLISKSYHLFTQQQRQRLALHGVDALVMGNNALLKLIRGEVLSLVKTSKMNTEYGKILQHNLNQILLFFGHETIRAYQVSTNKRVKQTQREQKKKMYSFEQVVQIAFAIEQSQFEEGLTPKQEICLKAARILLKTGWNATPLLELDHDDLFYLDTSINGNKTAAVRLFKRRAGYQTQWYDFDVPAEALGDLTTGKVVSAVMQDIENARIATAGLSKQLSQVNLHKRIFTYKLRDKARLLTVSSFTSCINKLLSKQELDITFDTRRIRKQGMNHTYRKVAKKFSEYRKAGHHTPAVFYKHYLVQDDKEVGKTLSDANAVMSDYFLRGVTNRVLFVAEKPSNAKKTPNGSCVQTKDSKVVAIFSANNRKVFGDEAIACADFSACLFCEHYRCIADAEHVWRLLSYKATVVRGMQSASTSFEGESLQSNYINGIKVRVKAVMEDMRRMNPNAVVQGEQIFQERGIHPDWTLTDAAI